MHKCTNAHIHSSPAMSSSLEVTFFSAINSTFSNNQPHPTHLFDPVGEMIARGANEHEVDRNFPLIGQFPDQLRPEFPWHGNEFNIDIGILPVEDFNVAGQPVGQGFAILQYSDDLQFSGVLVFADVALQRA